MKLTLELWGHKFTMALERNGAKTSEQHEHPDLDAWVERSGNIPDRAAELDHRLGFRSNLKEKHDPGGPDHLQQRQGWRPSR